MWTNCWAPDEYLNSGYNDTIHQVLIAESEQKIILEEVSARELTISTLIDIPDLELTSKLQSLDVQLKDVERSNFG